MFLYLGFFHIFAFHRIFCIKNLNSEKSKNSKGYACKNVRGCCPGINATTVTLEVNVSQGIKFMIVGLPDSAVRESHERVVSALKYNGYDLP